MITVKAGKNLNIRDILSRSDVANLPDAAQIMDECLLRSIEVRCGLIDGVAACVWGLIPPTILSDHAWLWLLTTNIIAEHKFLFIRHSQRYVEEALDKYPTIVGDVLVDNPQAIRWLKWLGAELYEPIGRRIPFSIRKKHRLAVAIG